MMFLQIVGGTLVALVIFAAALFFWLRWKIRSAAGGFLDKLTAALERASGAAKVPPMRLQLEVASATDWKMPESLQEYEAALQNAGFRSLGRLTDETMQDELGHFQVECFTNPDRQAFAAVFEVADGMQWMTISSEYVDGNRYTISTMQPDWLDTPSFLKIDNLPEYLPAALVEAFFERRPEGEMTTPPTGLESYRQMAEQQYAQEIEWRMARGGPTAAELHRLAQRNGQELNPDTVEITRTNWQYAYNEFLEEKLHAAFLEESGISAGEWENIRDRVTFVHDKQSADSLADMFDYAYECAFEQDDDSETASEKRSAEIRSIAESQSPRAAFAQLNSRLPRPHYQLYGKVEKPIEADVYLAPEDNY